MSPALCFKGDLMFDGLIGNDSAVSDGKEMQTFYKDVYVELRKMMEQFNQYLNEYIDEYIIMQVDEIDNTLATFIASVALVDDCLFALKITRNDEDCNGAMLLVFVSSRCQKASFSILDRLVCGAYILKFSEMAMPTPY